MVSLVRCLLISVLLVSQAMAVELNRFPGAELVQESSDNQLATYRMITGPIKRVNARQVPESFTFVHGKKRSQLLALPETRGTDTVSNFYREQLLATGELLYECGGRDCGNSSYWANVEFSIATLYGPEQYQEYLLGRSSNGDYVVVYVAQRATGKQYVYVSVISEAREQIKVDKGSVLSAIQEQGMFEFDYSDIVSLVTPIADAINHNERQDFALVVHDKLKIDESIEAAEARTLIEAKQILDQVKSAGGDVSRLTPIGAGPIAPIDIKRRHRVVLVLLN